MFRTGYNPIHGQIGSCHQRTGQVSFPRPKQRRGERKEDRREGETTCHATSWCTPSSSSSGRAAFGATGGPAKYSWERIIEKNCEALEAQGATPQPDNAPRSGTTTWSLQTHVIRWDIPHIRFLRRPGFWTSNHSVWNEVQPDQIV